MTLTEAKVEANQTNAQLSTGPRTEAGKATSSRNALRHGLTAATKLLPTEDPAELQVLTEAMFNDFKPLNATETALLFDLVDFEWRLRRAAAYEAKILSADAPDFKALNNMSLHAARIKRQFSATLKELQNLQRVSRGQREEQLAEAEAISKADRIRNRPSTLHLYGFDFTLDELKQWSWRKDNIAYSNLIIDEEGDEDDVDYANIHDLQAA